MEPSMAEGEEDEYHEEGEAGPLEVALTGELAWATWRDVSDGAARLLVLSITGGAQGGHPGNRLTQASVCLETVREAVGGWTEFDEARVEEGMLACVLAARPFLSTAEREARWGAVVAILERRCGPFTLQETVGRMKAEWRACLAACTPLTPHERMTVAEAGVEALTEVEEEADDGGLGDGAMFVALEPLTLSQQLHGTRAATEALKECLDPIPLHVRVEMAEIVIEGYGELTAFVRGPVAMAKLLALAPVGSRRVALTKILEKHGYDAAGNPRPTEVSALPIIIPRMNACGSTSLLPHPLYIARTVLTASGS
jgi:hypothetical protein